MVLKVAICGRSLLGIDKAKEFRKSHISRLGCSIPFPGHIIPRLRRIILCPGRNILRPGSNIPGIGNFLPLSLLVRNILLLSLPVRSILLLRLPHAYLTEQSQIIATDLEAVDIRSASRAHVLTIPI